MKKQYITPNTAVVKVRLFGSILDEGKINAASNTTTIIGARREDMTDDRFDWDEEE